MNMSTLSLNKRAWASVRSFNLRYYVRIKGNEIIILIYEDSMKCFVFELLQFSMFEGGQIKLIVNM